MRALFFAFEGSDASGKTTQASRFAQMIGARFTREPGDTPAGQRIRSLLLDHSPEGASLHPRTEALLMAADRAQHVSELIEPVLASGQHVVTDRYLASSVAYQGFARGLPPHEVRDLSLWATNQRVPDLTILLRVPVDVILTRLAAGGGLDRLESEGRDFFARVVHGFEVQAEEEPDRWLVIDGVGTIDEVAARLLDGVRARFPGLSLPS
jgi:dTMP kinase